MLSGFLIYRQFAAANLSRSAMPVLGRYAVRRAARIYPAYWVALAVLGAPGRAPTACHPRRPPPPPRAYIAHPRAHPGAPRGTSAGSRRTTRGDQAA